MADLLETLIKASERAGQVARACCTGSQDEPLLVAEKFDGEANARFDRDFKTIADVLAQESAKTEIAAYFPELAKFVQGEECSEIGGITISLKESTRETAALLSLLVTPPTAKKLARAAHSSLNVDACQNLPTDLPPLDINDLAIWIDPIDATAEFIAGVRGEAESDRGLPCVTVLIGAYKKSTGEPVIGVINQPFFNNGEGRVIWGVCYEDIKKWGGNYKQTDLDSKTIMMSGAEKPEIIEQIKSSGWKVKSVPGAGHKLLKVALGEAAGYIVSKGTTYRWDTCGPHAILRAKGGNILCYTKHTPLTYAGSDGGDTRQFCNSGGIIAYSDDKYLERIKTSLAI